MAQRLTITYGDNVLYDAEPEQFTWQESGATIEVKAGAAPTQANPLAGLAAALGNQRKQIQQ